MVLLLTLTNDWAAPAAANCKPIDTALEIDELAIVAALLTTLTPPVPVALVMVAPSINKVPPESRETLFAVTPGLISNVPVWTLNVSVAGKSPGFTTSVCPAGTSAALAEGDQVPDIAPNPAAKPRAIAAERRE
ncbi:hypothetical protein ACTT2I_08805 [Stenotrophomonas sp. PUT21]|uniref:hypothetical protein n=1 Tax=Stenotrophomonas TaxID=40323 RepID=UPI003B7C0438